MAGNLVIQPLIMPSPFIKSSPVCGDDSAGNGRFSRRFSPGVTSQTTFIATAQVLAPLQADPAKQAQNSKQPVSNTQSREQYNSGSLQPACTALDGTTFTHPAELFKASWKTGHPRVVKRIQKNRASSPYGTASTRNTAGRPKITDVVARRLIGQALGVNFGRKSKILSQMEESR